jgi:long-subunit acyl-CoA synthetase (AMP-forming)
VDDLVRSDGQVEAIGAALIARGLVAGQTVGIFSINRPEWTKSLWRRKRVV